MNKSLKERILSKIEMEPLSGCWLWSGGVGSDGYGKISVGTKTMQAHRLSYEVFKGNIGTMQVLHRCDVPCCVNPSHLFLGTNIDNVMDKIRKNRQSRKGGPSYGSKNYFSKLNEQDVLEIRKSLLSIEELAKKYGVTKHTVFNIKNRFSWKHI